MQHEAGRWRVDDRRADDAPAREPMRGAARPVDRRAPSADQKRVRREMARSTKTASSDIPSWADKDWETGEHAGVSNEGCPDCGDGHPAEYSHEGRWGQGPIFASPCPRTGTTDFLNAHGVDPAPEHLSSRTASQSGECAACGSTAITSAASCGPACSSCGCTIRRRGTRFEQSVATSDGRILLSPGDQIQTPTGQTINVQRVRRHETSRDHYYLDTDAGTSVVPWSTKFNLTPQNSSQQALPGMGTPGGNSNRMPLNPQAGGNVTETPGSCPGCGGKGTLNRRGDKFQCSRCGYTHNPMGEGMDFSDARQTIRSSKSTDLRSAVARRAAAVCAAPDKESDQ